MKVVFAGTPAIALPVLDQLSQHHDIQAVVTRPPARHGRSSKLVASPVEQWANLRGIEVLTPTKQSYSDFAKRLRQIAPDCCPVVAYGQILTARLLEIPTHGWINLHFSALPAYRGAAPVQRALLDGCTQTAITTFRIVPTLDAGPIFIQVPIEITAYETAGDLLTRMATIGGTAMVETLQRIAAGDQPYPQPTVGVSLAPKLTSEDARLDLAHPALQFVNQVRAMSPQPGAWALLDGQRFKILRASLIDDDEGLPDDSHLQIGQLWATNKALFCRLDEAWVELIEVQAFARKPMAGSDWARGAWKAGMCLG